MVIRMLFEIKPLHNFFFISNYTRIGRNYTSFKFHLLCLRETCDREGRKIELALEISGIIYQVSNE